MPESTALHKRIAAQQRQIEELQYRLSGVENYRNDLVAELLGVRDVIVRATFKQPAGTLTEAVEEMYKRNASTQVELTERKRFYGLEMEKMNNLRYGSELELHRLQDRVTNVVELLKTIEGEAAKALIALLRGEGKGDG